MSRFKGGVGFKAHNCQSGSEVEAEENALLRSWGPSNYMKVGVPSFGKTAGL